jgi:hypothetical protein
LEAIQVRFPAKISVNSIRDLPFPQTISPAVRHPAARLRRGPRGFSGCARVLSRLGLLALLAALTPIVAAAQTEPQPRPLPMSGSRSSLRLRP